MCILLNVKKHEKTFALNVDIFILKLSEKFFLTKVKSNDNIDFAAKCADDITKQSVHSHLSTDM